MLTGSFPIDRFQTIPTPYYYYDLDLLRRTLQVVADNAPEHNFHVHYALKANAAQEILQTIAQAGLGADCVSGGELEAALKAGIAPSRIVFAGVAKADWEIEVAIEADILCFNVESEAELRVIDDIACKKNKKARVCLRINPDIDAHTHKNITTGLSENKFGIQIGRAHV